MSFILLKSCNEEKHQKKKQIVNIKWIVFVVVHKIFNKLFKCNSSAVVVNAFSLHDK